MKMKYTRLNQLAVLAAGVLSAGCLSAQTLNFVPTAPVPGSQDIYSLTGALDDSGNVNNGAIYADGAGNDGYTYIANNRPSMGQIFKMGPVAGTVTAIWIRQVGYTNDPALTYWSFAANSAETFRITDPSQVNTAGFAVDTETYTITGTEPNNPGGFNYSTTGTGIWLRFGLANPVTLQANKTYGFDVTGIGGDFFETWGTTNAVYSGGVAYIGNTSGGLDDTTNLLQGDRAFLVEINGGTFAPPPVIAASITNQPANTVVPEGANATFSPTYGGTTPLSYQWYFNTNTVLTGDTNAVLVLGGVTTNMIGTYSVIVTNSSGSATSQVARLAVILPSITTNVGFDATGGPILDADGNGIGLPVRLNGTGSAYPGGTDDPNLLIDTSSGVLNITSPTCDFNGQLDMPAAEAVGFNLSSIGFTGTQDFTVTGLLTNSIVGENYDQAGIFAGSSGTNFARDGIIYNSDFTADPGAFGVGNTNGTDIGIATAAAPVGEMVATISRVGGVWGMSVNNLSVTPNAGLSYINTSTDMTVGVYALNTSGNPTSTTVNEISASLFTSPYLKLAKNGNSITLTWNVLSSGLLSSTNLANPNGWVLVPGVTGTSYTTAIPTQGTLFYKVAP
jgi:regulation of enolase protein 1 (concanavalin A-like superfamily)